MSLFGVIGFSYPRFSSFSCLFTLLSSRVLYCFLCIVTLPSFSFVNRARHSCLAVFDALFVALACFFALRLSSDFIKTYYIFGHFFLVAFLLSIYALIGIISSTLLGRSVLSKNQFEPTITLRFSPCNFQPQPHSSHFFCYFSCSASGFTLPLEAKQQLVINKARDEAWKHKVAAIQLARAQQQQNPGTFCCCTG